MTKDTIQHEGIVTQIKDTSIIISIQNQSACAACHAKGACGLSEVTQKNITAEKPPFPLAIGDRVIITATIQSALLSVLFAYIIPSVLIIGILATLILSGTNETTAAITTLLAMILYFFILYLFRNKFARKIKFRVKK